MFGFKKDNPINDQVVAQKKVELKRVKIDNDKLLDEVLEHFEKKQSKSLMNVQRGIESKENILNEVQRFLEQKRIDPIQSEEVKKQFEKYVWGYYILDDLINDPEISDIKVIGSSNVRIKRLGERMTSDVRFKSDDELKRFTSVVAVKNKINISDINAISTFTDKESNKDFILRFNISTEYINSTNTPYIHIRKIPKKKYTREEIIKVGLVTEEQLDFLIAKVRYGNGLFFTGKGASGKTTLMNYLIDQIPHNNSGLVIQENEELFSDTHPDLMFQKVKTSRGEGKIQYTLKDLAINGLLLDLDYFGIGEIKGGEALYFLNASYTGHKVMGSGHGVSSTEAIGKLVDYMKYESDYSRTDLMKMLKSLDTVVFLKDFKVQEISEIVGFNEKIQDLDYNMVFLGSKKINNSIRLEDKEKDIKVKEKDIKAKDIDLDKKDKKDIEKELEAEVRKLKDSGVSVKGIAEKLNCTVYKVNKILKG